MQGNHYDLGNPSPDGSVAMVSSAGHLAVIVLGGHGEHSSWVPAFGGTTHSVTREIIWRGQWLIAPSAAASSTKWPLGHQTIFRS